MVSFVFNTFLNRKRKGLVSFVFNTFLNRKILVWYLFFKGYEHLFKQKNPCLVSFVLNTFLNRKILVFFLNTFLNRKILVFFLNTGIPSLLKKKRQFFFEALCRIKTPFLFLNKKCDLKSLFYLKTKQILVVQIKNVFFKRIIFWLLKTKDTKQGFFFKEDCFLSLKTTIKNPLILLKDNSFKRHEFWILVPLKENSFKN